MRSLTVGLAALCACGGSVSETLVPTPFEATTLATPTALQAPPSFADARRGGVLPPPPPPSEAPTLATPTALQAAPSFADERGGGVFLDVAGRPVRVRIDGSAY